MRPLVHKLVDGLGWCGAALLVAATLPFIALTVLMLRTVFVAVAALVILGAIGLFCVHSPFRLWVAGQARS